MVTANIVNFGQMPFLSRIPFLDDIL